MPLARTADLVTAAHEQRRGVAAFNVITLEHAEAIMLAAEQAGVPTILQISHNAVRYHGGLLAPLTLACAALARAAGVPLAVHLDHAEDAGLIDLAAEAGCSSAMFDAGAMPYADNVAATAAAAARAHALGLWLEAELGHVGGKSADPRVVSAHAPGVRTDPGEAAAFVAATGVDALAVAVGSAHHMSTRTAALDHELIARLRVAVDVPLVLHGSSGVPDDELRAAVHAGIAKVNIGTALNVAFTGAVRESLAATPTPDPRGYLAAGREAMAATVRDRLLTISG